HAGQAGALGIDGQVLEDGQADRVEVLDRLDDPVVDELKPVVALELALDGVRLAARQAHAGACQRRVDADYVHSGTPVPPWPAMRTKATQIRAISRSSAASQAMLRIIRRPSVAMAPRSMAVRGRPRMTAVRM